MTFRPVRLAHGITLEPRFDGRTFLGWGRVACGNFPLRNPRRPMFVEIRNPAGILLRDFVLARKHVSPARVLLEFTMSAEQTGPMEYMVHTVRQRYNTTDWTQPQQKARDTRLQVELRSVSRRIGGRAFAGFSYQYRYRSRGIPIYKMLDRATWEPSGHAVGNEFWMRNCFTPAIVPIRSKRQFHSTEWYLPSCDNPNVFQFVPLQTELQGFTFTASAAGILVTWATRAAHVRSLFEKPRGDDAVVHWHEHCGDLAHEFVTAPMEVLWSAGGGDRGDRANAYEAVKELVHDTLHADVGLRRERITTYGQIEEWGAADLRRYARRGLPKLLAAGMKTVYIANHFENNMNTWGVSNFCCTVDYQVAQSVGPAKLRAFCRQAQAGGARVEMWGNTALSSLTEIFSRRNGPPRRIRFLPETDSVMAALKEAKQPFVRNPSNAIEADHYTPVFCVLNLRDPVVRRYWLRRWREAHQQIGLGGIFLDSSFNMSSDKFHWVQRVAAAHTGATADQTHLLGHYRPATEPPAAILSQYRAHLELMAAMQRMGYHYCNEDLGVFGTHRHGPGVQARVDNLFLWADCIASFSVPAIQKAGHDPDDVFFRGLAYRMMWALNWDIGRDALSWNYGGLRGAFDRPTARQLKWLRAFNDVAAAMVARTILPKERGVLYTNKRQRVLWAFEDLQLPLGRPMEVTDVVTGARQPTARLAARRHHVYVCHPQTSRVIRMAS